MTPAKRGIVISPPFAKLPAGGVRVGGYLSTFEIRKHLLYWDEIDYPDNNFISVDAGSDMQYLIDSGVALRTRVSFQGGVSSGSGEFFLEAQQVAFDKHNQLEPGAWSLAQPVDEPFFANVQSSLAIEFELWNSLPVPSNDVPLNEILEFKAKRRDELLALRVFLDEMHQAVISSADIPRAKNTQLSKLELSLKDVDRVLGEHGIRKIMTSLRGYIAGEYGNVLAAGGAGSWVGPLIGIDPVTAGALGAGFAFAIKPILSPRAPSGTHPLVYVSSIRQSFR
jgi:hypothetical protein